MDFLDKVKDIAADIAGKTGEKGKKLYDAAGDTFSTVADKTGKKSKELYTIAGYKLEIAHKQKAIRKLYREIGVKAYQAYCEQADIAAAIAAALAEVEALDGEISALKIRIEQEKNFEQVGVEDVPANSEDGDESAADSGTVIYNRDETEPMDIIE